MELTAIPTVALWHACWQYSNLHGGHSILNVLLTDVGETAGEIVTTVAIRL